MVCKVCGKEKTISKEIGVCLDCIRNNFTEAIEIIKPTHNKSRKMFNLPIEPPKDPEGIKCDFCINECKIPEKAVGYCGMKANINGKLTHLYGSPEKGLLDWYFDPLPTNCVAEWVCSGRDKYGYKNLAVFYRSCSFNCLFCQNWHFKKNKHTSISAEELADKSDSRTYCVCYFGGDPTTQILHAIKTSEILIKKNVKICWETNGSMNKKFIDKIANLSFQSGGYIKFDIKTFDEKLNIALCGVSNKNTLENFSYIAKKWKRKNEPFLVASTLLIPGYIDEIEIDNISKFISSLSPEIPYSLLAFYPTFFVYDLSPPRKKFVYDCVEIAKNNGLKNVNIGNMSLLW